jgi:hypothetical protein
VDIFWLSVNDSLDGESYFVGLLVLGLQVVLRDLWWSLWGRGSCGFMASFIHL